MNQMNQILVKKYGLITPPIDEEVEYILGDGWFQGSVIMPDGHGWANFLSSPDLQAQNGVETYNCSNYGTLNCLEALGKKKFGAQFQNDLSERYTGVMTSTIPGVGNDPHTVIETIRNYCGVVPNVFLPFDKTINTVQKYYSPKPMSYWLFATGKHWLKKYCVQHQWLWGTNATPIVKQASIKEALKFSPIGISVLAWRDPVNGIYVSYPGDSKNHWVCLFDYVEGEYWLIYDSYDKNIKKLDWGFDFGIAKGYGLDFNTGGATLGNEPEPVKLDYIAYYLAALIGAK